MSLPVAGEMPRSWEELGRGLLERAPAVPADDAVVGWLLPDGRMIDLAPAPDDGFGPGRVEHADSASWIRACCDDLERAGIARFRVGDEGLITRGGQSIFIEIARPLTSAQRRSLLALIRVGDHQGRSRELCVDVLGRDHHIAFCGGAVDLVSVHRLLATAQRRARGLSAELGLGAPG